MTLITFDRNKYLTAIHQSSGLAVLEGGIEIDDLPFDVLNDVLSNLEAYQYIDGKLVKDEQKAAELQEEMRRRPQKPTTDEILNAMLGVM